MLGLAGPRTARIVWAAPATLASLVGRRAAPVVRLSVGSAGSSGLRLLHLRQLQPAGARRFSSSSSGSGSGSGSGRSLEQQEAELRAQVAAGSISGTKQEAAYALAFTCNVCETRSAKLISKQAYHHGVVIVRCGECKKQHLIADHFKWFEDEATDIEKIMREKGEEVRKLNHFQLAGAAEGQGQLVQVEGFDCGAEGPPPVPEPVLGDSEELAATALAIEALSSAPASSLPSDAPSVAVSAGQRKEMG